MKTLKHFIVTIVPALLFNAMNAQTPLTTGTGFNYSTFTPATKNITPELQSLTDKKFYDHPEYGVLPYNAPCKDCIELLQKRDETHRYFVKEGSNGKVFYQQSSYGSQSYMQGGVLRTIDQRLAPSARQGVYNANRQPVPVAINIPERFTSLLNAGRELQVNRNLSIFNMHPDGSITSLGEPNWSDYTAGDDGVRVHNLYPGVDLELKVGRGNIESFYRINKPLNLQDGWLVIRDNIKVPEQCVYDYTYSEKQANGFYEGTLFINNTDGIHYFYIGAPAAYDVNVEGSAINLNYQVSNDRYDLLVPVAWMNDSKRSYPLVVDPLISATSVFLEASITGSGYSASCTPFTNGCPYLLEVYVPAATIVYDLLYTFNYNALGTCWLSQGGWDMTYSTCKSPIAVGLYHTCHVNLPGLCLLPNQSCYNSPTENMQSCIPAPQCSAYYMPFTMNFYRCTQPGSGCGFSCINASSDWDMTVEGYYITVRAKDTTICNGQIANLIAYPDSGIASSGYTFKWYASSGLIGTSNPLTVSPTVTTTYTVTAFDCQAQGLDTLTDSAQTTLTVTIDTCTGIIESSLSDLIHVYPNPSQGSFTIQSDAVKTDYVDAEIYNVMGEKIYSILIREEDMRKGYQLRLDVAGGLYLLVLRAGDAVAGKKISVLK